MFKDTPEGQTHYCERCETPTDINLEHTCGLSQPAGDISSVREEWIAKHNASLQRILEQCVDAQPFYKYSHDEDRGWSWAMDTIREVITKEMI